MIDLSNIVETEVLNTLTNQWTPFSQLRKRFSWGLLDGLYQDGVIDCKIEPITKVGFRNQPFGTIHYYKLKKQ